MPDTQGRLYLFEALELRAEYDARIKGLKECLNTETGGRKRLGLWGNDDRRCRPSPDFDASRVRADLRALEFKRRKLNSAIQQANFATTTEIDGAVVNLLEALETRKGLNQDIAELQEQMTAAAYQTVIYKEGRDILVDNEVSFTQCRNNLDTARRAFRDLNRKLRRATYETTVAFADE